VSYRGAVGVVLAARANHLVQLGLHQLVQHTEADPTSAPGVGQPASVGPPAGWRPGAQRPEAVLGPDRLAPPCPHTPLADAPANKALPRCCRNLRVAVALRA
jgi:hypothetical protein